MIKSPKDSTVDDAQLVFFKEGSAKYDGEKSRYFDSKRLAEYLEIEADRRREAAEGPSQPEMHCNLAIVQLPRNY